MNIISSIKSGWNKTKEIAGNAAGFVKEKAVEYKDAAVKVGAAVLGVFGFGQSSAQAQTTPTDYGAVLTSNLEVINTIWGTVATIMVAVALVTVGVRFFRKTK